MSLSWNVVTHGMTQGRWPPRDRLQLCLQSAEKNLDKGQADFRLERSTFLFRQGFKVHHLEPARKWQASGLNQVQMSGRINHFYSMSLPLRFYKLSYKVQVQIHIRPTRSEIPTSVINNADQVKKSGYGLRVASKAVATSYHFYITSPFSHKRIRPKFSN